MAKAWWRRPQLKFPLKGKWLSQRTFAKPANLKKGEKILVIAVDDMVVLKKIIDKSFEETMKPVWVKVRQMGLSEEDINALIDEARAKSSF